MWTRGNWSWYPVNKWNKLSLLSDEYNWMAPDNNHVTAIFNEIFQYVRIHTNFGSQSVWFEKMFLCCFSLKAGRNDLTNRLKFSLSKFQLKWWLHGCCRSHSSISMRFVAAGVNSTTLPAAVASEINSVTCWCSNVSFDKTWAQK